MYQQYRYIAFSKSKTLESGLGYSSQRNAQEHCNAMNELLKTYDDPNSGWNKNFWKMKPSEWTYELNPDFNDKFWRPNSLI